MKQRGRSGSETGKSAKWLIASSKRRPRHPQSENPRISRNKISQIVFKNIL